MFDIIKLTIFLYSCVAVPITIIIIIIGLRNKIKWHILDFIAVYIPFVVWMLLLYIIHRTKSLSNLIELLICGAVGGLILIPKIIFHTDDKKSNKYILISIVAAIIIVFVIFFATPILPE